MDPTLLATAFRDRRDAGVFLQLIGVLEASAILPEGGEQPWCQMRARTCQSGNSKRQQGQVLDLTQSL